MMIVFEDNIVYNVLGRKIILISDRINDSQNTVAEIEEIYYYLGNETANVLAAVLAWQEFSGRDLTEDELNQVMIDNNLVSAAI
jgi:C4-dicarboxylate transporter